MTLVMEVPEKLSGDVKRMKIMLAINLYEKRKISLSEAAEMTNVNTADFMNIMSDYNDGIIFE